MLMTQTRRRLLTTMALGGAVAILPYRKSEAAEPPPETTTVRLAKYPVICFAPQYVSDELLHAEGFTDIRYVEGGYTPGMVSHELGSGKFDFSTCLTMHFIAGIDAGEPIAIVSGSHPGCFELFVHEGIRGITDLKGKTVATTATPELMQAIASYVGLNPKKDLTLVNDPTVKPLELFAQGKIDAYLALPPEPQELHARGIGHVILRTAVDQPWAQYFCCSLAANRDFVLKHPVATKRVIRALLKATDLCASEPERVARRLVDGGFTDRYDYALQMLNENPYGHWRDYDAKDSVRFYALRMQELGMIKNNPKRIAEEGTDSRFVDQLKRELKA
jgi:NitT/TauT family transport system substrate-binding protein